MKQNFQILQSRYRSYQHIYTDGSKDEEKVGCAFISGGHSSSLRIPDGSSVFTAEAKAIDLALLAGDQLWPRTSGGRLHFAHAITYLLRHRFGHFVNSNK